MNNIIKNFEVVGGCFAVFILFTNNKYSKVKMFVSIISAIILTSVCVILDKYSPFLTYYIMFIIFHVLVMITLEKKYIL